MDRQAVADCVKNIAQGMAETIADEAIKRFDKLTADEVQKFTIGEDVGYYIARVLCLSAVEDQCLYSWSCDSMQKNRLVQRMCRIINKRP